MRASFVLSPVLQMLQVLMHRAPQFMKLAIYHAS